jgi:hypothetical protein
MKPVVQRIAIAEACGWKRNKGVIVHGWSNGKEWRLECDLPDYCNSLDDMHEAIATIPNGEQETQFMYHLYRIWTKFPKDVVDCTFKVGHVPIGDMFRLTMRCTARQLAEAFLRTLSLWVDEPAKPETKTGE